MLHVNYPLITGNIYLFCWLLKLKEEISHRLLNMLSRIYQIMYM